MAYKLKVNGIPLKTKDDEEALGQDYVNIEIKELNETEKSFWAVASDESEDRVKDIIRVEGWNLKNYKNNPVGLFVHNYYDLPVFRSSEIKINKDTKQLLFKPVFSTHDRARDVFNCYAQGFMKTFSVGFAPKEYTFRNEDDKWGGGIEYTKGHELLEISAVPVPANPNARVIDDSFKSLIEEENNLFKLGYINEFKFDEEKGIYWNPIVKDLEAYKEPREIALNENIRVVSAIPRFDIGESNIKSSVIGYYFNSSTFNEDLISDWMKENCPKKFTSKYYKLDDDFKLTLIEEVVEEIKTVEFSDDEFIEKDLVEKPLENEHACRINDPSNYEKFARKNCAQKHDDKCIDVIYGIKDNKSEIQSLRYKKDIWTAEEAKSHCNGRDGTFEAAKDIEIPIAKEESPIDLVKVIESVVLSLFDKYDLPNVKVLLEEMNKSIFEIKSVVESLRVKEIPEEVLNFSANSDEIITLSLDEFPPVSQPDSSEKFTINPEEFKTIVDESFASTFINVFDETLLEISGKLD